MPEQDNGANPPANMTKMDVTEARFLAESNKGRGTILLTYRKVSENVGRKDASYFELILVVQTPHGEISDLGELATTVDEHHSSVDALANFWRTELGLTPMHLYEYQALRDHAAAKNARRKL